MIIQQILQDIAVELTDEFDRNFERQAFFNQKWQRHNTPIRQGAHILVRTGALRASLSHRIAAAHQHGITGSLTFQSTLPYAAIHNQGGHITVTRKMQRFFWAQYHQAKGKAKLKTIPPEAIFWRNMALKKVGSKIKIPQRQFIGTHPQVIKLCEDIISENLQQHFADNIITNIKP